MTIISVYVYEGSNTKYPNQLVVLPSGKSIQDCLVELEGLSLQRTATDSAKELLEDEHDDFCVYCGIGVCLICVFDEDVECLWHYLLILQTAGGLALL